MFQSNILAVGALIRPKFNIYFKNLAVKTLIITIADDVFYSNFLHFGYKKIYLNQMKLIEK